MADPVAGRPDACPRCGAQFRCGRNEGDDRCWCAERPAIPPVPEQWRCYCPACLEELIAARTRA